MSTANCLPFLLSPLSTLGNRLSLEVSRRFAILELKSPSLLSLEEGLIEEMIIQFLESKELGFWFAYDARDLFTVSLFLSTEKLC